MLIENRPNWKMYECDGALPMEKKFFSNINRINTEFTYLCGDGLLPNLELICNTLNENADKDFICLIKKGIIFHKNYLKMIKIKDKKIKFSKLFYFLTFCGGSLVKTSLLKNSLVEEIDFNSNFLYPITILNNVNFDAKYTFAVGDFFQISKLKKQSTWFDKESIVNIRTLNYVKSVFLLKTDYDDIKPYILKSNYDKVFSLKNLLRYKKAEVFDLKIYKKYMRYYKMCGYNIISLYIVCFIPMRVIKIISKFRMFIKLCLKKH